MGMRGHTLEDLAAALGGRVAGDTALEVVRPRHPARAESADEIALALDPTLHDLLADSPVRAAVLPEGVDWQAMGLDGAVLVAPGSAARIALSESFATPAWSFGGIHASAVIHTDARLGEGVEVGPLCVVGEGAEIGAGARILASATVGAAAQIGPGCVLHPGVRIGDRVHLGARVTVYPNACVGVDGFSFPLDAAGERHGPRRIRSLGTVEVEDDVEIGAGCAIDRGTVESTWIGKGTKLDNLVHVAHNVSIGRHCLVSGQVGIAGSAVIGDRCVFGGQVGVGDHVVIGEECLIGGKSMVGRRVAPRSILVGWASLEQGEFHRVFRAIRRLARQRTSSSPESS